MSNEPSISAIVLAGGQARRMAGRDKGLIPFDGLPLIAAVLHRLAPQVDEIIISANRHMDEYAKLGYPVVTDASADYRGPLAGIHAAGQRTRGEWLLITPCDTPFLPPDLAQRLLTQARASGVRLACAADDTQTHPATMLMHRSLLSSLAECLTQGQLKVQAWQTAHGCAVARFPGATQAFMNINTPDDLTAAQQLLSRG